MSVWNVYYKRYRDEFPIVYVEEDVPGNTPDEALRNFWLVNPMWDQYAVRILKIEEATY